MESVRELELDLDAFEGPFDLLLTLLLREELEPGDVDMAAIVVAFVERLAARAAVTGDRQLVRKALLAHPLVGQWDLVTALEKGIFETGGRLLPQFA